ncbi:MAG: hypothetical protein K8H74_03090 [Notoacmeibacter sp.]|nr:hypothetical protein [Notoacmeibacter sp.]
MFAMPGRTGEYHRCSPIFPIWKIFLHFTSNQGGSPSSFWAVACVGCCKSVRGGTKLAAVDQAIGEGLTFVPVDGRNRIEADTRVFFGTAAMHHREADIAVVSQSDTKIACGQRE